MWWRPPREEGRRGLASCPASFPAHGGPSMADTFPVVLDSQRPQRRSATPPASGACPCLLCPPHPPPPQAPAHRPGRPSPAWRGLPASPTWTSEKVLGVTRPPPTLATSSLWGHSLLPGLSHRQPCSLAPLRPSWGASSWAGSTQTPGEEAGVAGIGRGGRKWSQVGQAAGRGQETLFPERVLRVATGGRFTSLTPSCSGRPAPGGSRHSPPGLSDLTGLPGAEADSRLCRGLQEMELPPAKPFASLRSGGQRGPGRAGVTGISNRTGDSESCLHTRLCPSSSASSRRRPAGTLAAPALSRPPVPPPAPSLPSPGGGHELWLLPSSLLRGGVSAPVA